MTTTRTNYKMKDYPEETRPRERMEMVGPQALTDRELLAIILSTGSKKRSALELADALLNQHGGLKGLIGLSIQELSSSEGIGPAKGTSILAALEIGKRISGHYNAYRPIIGSSQDASALLMEKMRYLDREHFTTVLLNTKSIVLGIEEVSIGTLNSSMVHPREVYKNAIKKNANAIILGHNHPSGDCTPSEEDIAITKRLCEAGIIIGIRVLDHIIIGDHKYYSFKENGLL